MFETMIVMCALFYSWEAVSWRSCIAMLGSFSQEFGLYWCRLFEDLLANFHDFWSHNETASIASDIPLK